MKKTHLLAIGGLVTTMLFTFNVQSRPDGAPAAASGGPAEGGATCSQGGCHGGAVTPNVTYLSTDIPAEGYTPGTMYTISISVPASGKKGFMFSAQDSIGNFKGSVAAGSGSEIFSTNYVTHSLANTNNPGTWTFNWTAPAAGSGKVNLHAAFAVGTGSTRTQVLSVNEKLSSGLNEFAQQIGLTSYQHNGELVITFNQNTLTNGQVQIMSLNGQVNSTLFNGALNAGENVIRTSTTGLKTGIYLLQVRINNQIAVKKLLIN